MEFIVRKRGSGNTRQAINMMIEEIDRYGRPLMVIDRSIKTLNDMVPKRYRDVFTVAVDASKVVDCDKFRTVIFDGCSMQFVETFINENKIDLDDGLVRVVVFGSWHENECGDLEISL